MRDFDETDFEFAKKYMVTDEYILWKGRPGKGRILTLSDLYMIPISIILFAWVVSGAYINMFSEKDSIFSHIFTVLYVLVAFYILIGRFVHVWLIRSHSYYVITNRKIIRKRLGKIDTLSLSNMPSMDTTFHKNGYGTISFGSVGYDRNKYRTTIPRDNDRFALENIEDAAKVQDIISTACNDLQTKAQ